MIKVIEDIPCERLDYGVQMINAISQWSQTKGEGINIAIIDTGIDYTHYELKDKIKGGINFTNENNLDYMDRNGHGTFCAGIIAGADNESGIVGVAPEANLFAVKALGDDSKGSLLWLAQALDWCINNNIHIISMSLGYDKDIKMIYQLIQLAYEKGIIMVAAAGNDNSKNQVDYPARYEEVIGVTAIDMNKKIGGFCTAGDEVEFAAPGVNITSTYLNNKFAVMSGTSMATPHIAGAIALIQSKSLKERGKLYSLEEVQEILRLNTSDLGDLGKDNKYGHGLFHF